jgi:hypothetical protein
MIKKLLVPTSGSPDDDSVFARTLNVVRPLDAYFEFYHLQFSASETAVRPDGHFKFLHLWPPQNPPLDSIVTA